MRSTANYSQKGFQQSKNPENLFLYKDPINQSFIKHEESNYSSTVIVGEHKNQIIKTRSFQSKEILTLIPPIKLSLKNLGWTLEETIDARNRLSSFEEDWEAPGMELYDEL